MVPPVPPLTPMNEGGRKAVPESEGRFKRTVRRVPASNGCCDGERKFPRKAEERGRIEKSKAEEGGGVAERPFTVSAHERSRIDGCASLSRSPALPLSLSLPLLPLPPSLPPFLATPRRWFLSPSPSADPLSLCSPRAVHRVRSPLLLPLPPFNAPCLSRTRTCHPLALSLFLPR